jgi:phage baseplate assembly protein gpV
MSWRTASEAISTLGIDPRKWISVGTITEIYNDETGLYCDCELPTADLIRARVMVPYGGKSLGIELPYHQGDEVVIAFPEGDPDLAIILGCLHNEENTKPNNNNEKLLIKAKDNEPLEVVAPAGTKIKSNTEIDGTLQVDQPTTLKDTLEVNKSTTLKGTLSVQNNTTVNNLNINGILKSRGQPGISQVLVLLKPGPNGPEPISLTFDNGVLTLVS